LGLHAIPAKSRRSPGIREPRRGYAFVTSNPATQAPAKAARRRLLHFGRST
jgi:hypothetical protein